jgi:hypothetical protein
MFRDNSETDNESKESKREKTYTETKTKDNTTRKETPTSTDSTETEEPSSTKTEENPPFLARYIKRNNNLFDEYPHDESHIRLIPYSAVNSINSTLFMEPSDENVTKQQALEMTLTNNTNSIFETSLFSWQLHKEVDGEWFNVALHYPNEILQFVEPGEKHVWSLIFDHERIQSALSLETIGPGSVHNGLGEWSEELYLAGLGGGQYLFGISGWFGQESPNAKTSVVAEYTLDSDQLSLEPTDDLREVHWDNDTLLASTEPRKPEWKRENKLIVKLERITNPSKYPPRIITEQLWRDPPAWDVIALSREFDAKRVRLEENNAKSDTNAFRQLERSANGIDGTYEYEGEYYTISTHDEKR